MTYRTSIVTGLLLLLSGPATWAQQPLRPDPVLWGLCEPDPLAPLLTVDTGAPADVPIEFTADFAEATPTETILEGEVEIEQGDRRVYAPQVIFDRMTNRITAEDVAYGEPGLAVRSQRAELDLTDEFGLFHEAEYYLPLRNAQGSAEWVETDRNTLQSRLLNATISTCERGREAWQLRARRMDINEAEGWGTARHITLAIRGVPVLYFPYLSFPLTDERKSGFLFPEAGYRSRNGFDLTIPYYWNIAPHRDMTIAPRILTRRGLLLGAEYRFLNPRDRGEIILEYLPDDRVRGEDRSATHVWHRASPRPNLRTDLLFQHVSDDDYIDDLGNTLELLNPTSLESHLEVIYFGSQWTALGRLQGFQTIDDEVFTPANRPFNRLPQLRFDGLWPRQWFGLDYELNSELVHFDREDSITGLRLDLKPTLSLPLEWPAGFLIPRLSYRYTAYDLRNTPPGIDTNPSRDAPIASVDGGLFFERPLQWGDWTGIQTLEPRLFYLYVPFRDQTDIPVFDSVEIDRTFTWLFLENRFTGADRLGDANQLTTALTSRLLDAATGRERLRFSVGQVQFFRDREVSLRSRSPGTDSRSEIFAELEIRPVWDWSARATLQWDPVENNTERSTLDLRYRPGERRLGNIAYRFARNQVEQVDVSLIWPIGVHWRTMARWNYDLRGSQSLDAFLGLEYEECCWVLRGLVRNSRDTPRDEAETSVRVELVLKGLADVGTNIDKLLEDTILGFQRIRYR